MPEWDFKVYLNKILYVIFIFITIAIMQSNLNIYNRFFESPAFQIVFHLIFEED